MAADIGKILKDALSNLKAEKDKIDRQISAIQGALAAMNGAIGKLRRAGSGASTQGPPTVRSVKRRPRMRLLRERPSASG